jgi:hypothetical protein
MVRSRRREPEGVRIAAVLVVAAPIVGLLAARLVDAKVWTCRYGGTSCIVDLSPAVALLVAVVAGAMVWACICAWVLAGIVLAGHAWRLDRDQLILAIGTALVTGAGMGALRFAAASGGRLRDAVAVGVSQAILVAVIGVTLALVWAAIVSPRLQPRTE